MNNKGILKEEVRRILEMMEVSEKKSKLLNEGIIDDVVQGVVKLGTKSGDDVLTVLAKLEDELGIPKGVLDSDDIFDLIKGTSNEQITILSKIVKNMGQKQLDNLTTKVWAQLKDVHTNMLNGVTSIKSSGGKITTKDIDEMSEIAISSTKPGFDPLINALRKEFKTKMTKSLEGYIDASGSAGKIRNVADNSADIDKEIENILNNSNKNLDSFNLLKKQLQVGGGWKKLSLAQRNVVNETIDTLSKQGKNIKEIEFDAKKLILEYLKNPKTKIDLPKSFWGMWDSVWARKKSIAIIGGLLLLAGYGVKESVKWTLETAEEGGEGVKEWYNEPESEEKRKEESSGEPSTYTNDLTGLKNWSKDSGYTDAEISGGEAWYKDTNGEWQQAFYSNNSWN
jgi:hypothetical protein